MTRHEMLVQIASTKDANCSGFDCPECPVSIHCHIVCNDEEKRIMDQNERFAAAKMLTKEARSAYLDRDK